MSQFRKLRFIDLIVGEPLKREEARVPPSETKSSSRESCSLPERLAAENLFHFFNLDAKKYKSILKMCLWFVIVHWHDTLPTCVKESVCLLGEGGEVLTCVLCVCLCLCVGYFVSVWLCLFVCLCLFSSLFHTLSTYLKESLCFLGDVLMKLPIAGCSIPFRVPARWNIIFITCPVK